MRLYVLVFAIAAITPVHAQSVCAPAAQWTLSNSQAASAAEVIGSAAQSSVVLLGEIHDNADHHRWQLQTIAALNAIHPKMVLGFESFPRRVQGALDRWVSGEIGEVQFLAETDWRRVWNFDPALYMPIFQFARINRVPMRALNVDSDLVHLVSQVGLNAVPPGKREGVGNPAPPSTDYVDRLFQAYSAHLEKGQSGARTDTRFQHFVESQLLWDRAMAEAIAAVIARDPQVLVVGIIGSGHVALGHGVPHQLESLGVKPITSLLPWDADGNCRDLSPGYATAVFGLPEKVR